jgi:hypothetical protein
MNLKFSQRCCWRFKVLGSYAASSRRFERIVVPSFQGRLRLLDPEGGSTTKLSKPRELLIELSGINSQKSSISSDKKGQPYVWGDGLLPAPVCITRLPGWRQCGSSLICPGLSNLLSQFQPHGQGSQLNSCMWDDRVRFLTETEIFLVIILFGPALGPTEPEV